MPRNRTESDSGATKRTRVKAPHGTESPTRYRRRNEQFSFDWDAPAPQFDLAAALTAPWQKKWLAAATPYQKAELAKYLDGGWRIEGGTIRGEIAISRGSNLVSIPRKHESDAVQSVRGEGKSAADYFIREELRQKKRMAELDGRTFGPKEEDLEKEYLKRSPASILKGRYFGPWFERSIGSRFHSLASGDLKQMKDLLWNEFQSEWNRRLKSNPCYAVVPNPADRGGLRPVELITDRAKRYRARASLVRFPLKDSTDACSSSSLCTSFQTISYRFRRARWSRKVRCVRPFPSRNGCSAFNSPR